MSWDGIPVTVKKNGKTEEKRAIVINFKEPEKNSFLAVKEMKIHGELYRRRTDIVGFVNGLPLLFIELKRNDVDVENAYTDNYTDYQDTIPFLFYYNAFLILSNGMEAKVGTLGSKYEFFHEWKSWWRHRILRRHHRRASCADGRDSRNLPGNAKEAQAYGYN